MPKPGPYTVQASSEAWPNAGSQAERALTDSWIFDQTLSSTGGEATNAAPSSGTAFLSSGDGTTGASGTSFYALTRKLRVIHGGGTAYCRVISASYSTTTTLTTVGVGNFQSGTTSLSTASITSVAASPLYWGSSGYAPGNEAGLYATGDMLYRDSTGVTRLAVGTSGQTLYGGTVPQWAAAPVSAMTQIAQTLLSTAAANFDFTGIPASYNHLKLVVQIRYDAAAAGYATLRFNNDTGGNYEEETWAFTDGAGFTAAIRAANSFLRFAQCPGTNTPANFAGVAEVTIYNYKNTTFYKQYSGHGHAVADATPNYAGIVSGGSWRSTAAITQVTVNPPSGNFIAGSIATLYGLT